MGLKKKISKKAAAVKKAVLDKKNRARAKAEVRKRIAQGKVILRRIEAKLRDPRTQEQLKKKAAEIKRKARTLKIRFKAESKKAEAYTRKNPRKAVAVAVAAGVLIGTLWAALHRKK